MMYRHSLQVLMLFVLVYRYEITMEGSKTFMSVFKKLAIKNSNQSMHKKEEVNYKMQYN